MVRVRSLLALIVCLALLCPAGFGIGGQQETSTRGVPTPRTAKRRILPTSDQPSQSVAVTVSDDPGASVVSFTVTIDSITLVSTTGATVQLVSKPVSVEFTHLAGNSLPLGAANVPVGTYNRASVTLANPVLTYINPTTGQPVQKTLPPGPVTVPLPLDPNLVVSSTGMTINFELSVFGSIAIDAAGNVTFTPQITPFHQPIPPVLPFPPLPSPFPIGTGFEHVIGTVAAVSAPSFTVTVGAQTLKFTTNSTTHFDGVSGLAALTAGTLISVDAVIQQDGTLLALYVHALQPPGIPSLVLTGLVTSTTGSPVTSFQITPQQLISPTALLAAPSVIINIQVPSSTVFKIDSDNVDLHGLPFTPTFDRSTITAGQNVEVHAPVLAFTTTPVAGAANTVALIASEVDLEQQALVGTVSNLTSTSFTLTLAPGSSFTSLTKATTVTVYRQATTDVGVGVTLANGAQVLARGLVFRNSGAYSMVASRVSKP